MTASVGFIGTGTIGGPMAMKLLEHGHPLTVFDVNSAATAAHVDRGAAQAAAVSELARGCQTIFLSLPGPKEIEQVMQAPDGILAHARPGTTVVDLSTSSVQLSRAMAERAAARDMEYLDAPVSGGKQAAEAGTLAVMVGGQAAAFERVRALIACFGEHIFYMGDSGAGTLTKLVNNQIFLSASVLIQEAFVMGAKAGMDPAALMEVLKVSSAGPLLAPAPLVLSRKFNLGVFALSIAAKDVGLALESAASAGVEMPMAQAALETYQAALEAGLAQEDFFATLKTVEARAGVELQPLKRRKN